VRIFRPLPYVPYYIFPRYIPIAAPSTSFVFFADSGTGSEGYLGSSLVGETPTGSDGSLGLSLGPESPTGNDGSLSFGLIGDTPSGSEGTFGDSLASDSGAEGDAAYWSASLLFVDMGAEVDGSLGLPSDGDFAFDPLGGLGGGGGSGASGSFWTKTFDFLVLPMVGDSGIPADGFFGAGRDIDNPFGNDGGLASGLGGDSGLGAENDTLSIVNAGVASADSGSGSESVLLGWIGAESAVLGDGYFGSGIGNDQPFGNDGGLASSLGGDAGSGSETDIITLFNPSVISTDSATASESSFLIWLGSDVPTGLDGSGAFSLGADFGSLPEFSLSGFLAGDYATESDSAFLITGTGVVLAFADSGLGSEGYLLGGIAGDVVTGFSPGGGGLNSVVFSTSLLLGDSTKFADSGFIAHAVAADSGLEGDFGTSDILTFGYHIYDNGGSGPINYSSIVATILGFTTTTWTSAPLTFPDTWKFGVRAFNANGEEQNLTCAVTLVLDSSGIDITNRPIAPTGLRAFATVGGGIRVEWTYIPTTAAKLPTGFHVYIGTGGTPSYGSPVATVSYQSSIANMFVANLASLTDGTAYTIGVRSYNSTAEEPNTNTVTVTADATGPTAVVSLTAIAIT
jgi:hypothetical protein